MIRTAFVLLMAMQLFGGGEKNTREGAEHFEAGRLEEALRAFSRAEGAFPDAPENDLNIAGVHYRLGEAEGGPASGGEEGPLAEALRGYQAALGGGADGEVRRDAFYNLANTLFRAGAFREAAAAYGEAIALDPEDREARQNLERALRAADDHEQQDEQQDGGQGGDQQEPGSRSRTRNNRTSRTRDRRAGLPVFRRSGPGLRGGAAVSSPRTSGRAGSAARRRPSGNPPQDGRPGADTPDSLPGEVPEISPEQAERILPRSPTSSGPSRRTVSRNAGLARCGGADTDESSLWTKSRAFPSQKGWGWGAPPPVPSAGSPPGGCGQPEGMGIG